MWGTSRWKLHQELGLKPLQHKHWCRKLCNFYKIYKNQSPRYLNTLRCLIDVPVILSSLKFSPNSTYNCFNNKGIKHIIRLGLELSHLPDHKFKHGFFDSLNPICSCELDIDSTCLLHCHNFTNERSILLNAVSRKNENIFFNSYDA